MNRGRRLKVGAAVVCLLACAGGFGGGFGGGAIARAQITSTSGSGGGFDDYLAHGSSERFWLARVAAGTGEGAGHQTTVYVRAAGERRWQEVRRVDGRGVALAHREGQLALLLADGNWLLVSGESVATGRPVPAGTLIDLATRGEALLGMSRVPLAGRAAPAPGAADRAPGAAPDASTAPVPADTVRYRLHFYTLESGQWTESAAPLEIAGGGSPSMAVVDGVSYVAFAAGPRAVEVHRHVPQSGWTRHAVAASEGDVREFDLLGGGAVPVLLTQEWDAARPARLHWVRQGAGAQSVPVEPPSGARAYAAAAAVAVGKVRVLFATTDEMNLLERSYDLLGPAAGAQAVAPAAAGEPAQVVLPRPSLSPVVMFWARALVTLALVFTVIASVRRRREMQETMQTAVKLPLAPPGRRLLAGLIDALPLIGGVAVYARGGAWTGSESFEQVGQVAALAGVGLYLLHTTVAELVTGRTLGKLCCGLRVVSLDGGRPRAGALLARNLLRVIDVSVFFFPLVLVLYSPLRQRAGDVAAGTLVVLNKPTAEGERSAEDKPPAPVEAPK